MKNTIFAFALLAITATYSCVFDCVKGVGVESTKTLNIEEFNGISSSTSVDVVLIPSKENKAVISGDSNLVNLVSLETSSGNLEIGFDGINCVSMKLPMTIELYYTEELNSISINGSGSVTSKSVIITPEMSIRINGSGDVALKAEVENLEIGIQGSGSVRVEGHGKEAGVGISGSGDVELFDFELNAMAVSVNGSGSVEAFVNNMLKVNVNGSGDVYYKGNAKTNISTNGSGEVKRVN